MKQSSSYRPAHLSHSLGGMKPSLQGLMWERLMDSVETINII
jgi:hypothetical protein